MYAKRPGIYLLSVSLNDLEEASLFDDHPNSYLITVASRKVIINEPVFLTLVYTDPSLDRHTGFLQWVA
jgi:hypothetical protein